MSKTTNAPKGLGISRKGNKYTFSWSKKETYEKIQLEYEYTTITKQKNASFITQHGSGTKNLTGGKSSYVATISANNVDHVDFRVRAKADKKSWSAWQSDSFQINLPANVKLKAEWKSETPNKTTFTYTAEDSDHRPYDKIKYQTMWVENCPKDAGGLNWPNKATENTNKSGTLFNSVENDYLSGSHARVVRAKAHGQGGWQKNWTYSRHVYAKPNAAENLSGTATVNPLNATIAMELSWDLKVSAARPVDTQTVQWQIGQPLTGMTPPPTGWQDDETPVHEEKRTENEDETLGTNNWSGTINQVLENNQCLWLRVHTKHDNQDNYSEPVRLLTGSLAAPSGVNVTPYESTHTYSVSATNNASDVADTFMVIVASTLNGNVNLGVLAHGSSGPVNINSPVWPAGKPFDIGVKAVIGTYTVKTVTEGSRTYSSYIVDEVMSSDITWQTVHTAPAIDLVPADTEGTATVTWDFPWDEATQAEVSWADHADAWNSTDQPSTHTVENPAEGKLNISGLEPGTTYYVRVRLIKVSGDSTVYGAYSATREINLAAAPAVPTLQLSENMITPTDTVVASWVYVSNDKSQQKNALLAVYDETNDTYTPISPMAGAEQTYTINASDLGTGTHAIRVKVYSERGMESPWSLSAYLTISEPLTCTIADTSLVAKSVEVDPEDYSGSTITFNGGDEENIKDVTSLSVDLEPTASGYTSVDAFVNDEYKYAKDKVPYTFKASHYDNTREIDAIVGGTVAWNQLGDLRTNSSTSNGITFTASSGKISASGTATAAASYSAFKTNIPCTSGHKYLLSGCPKNGSATTYSIVASNYSVTRNPRDIGNGAIFSAYETGDTNLALIVNNGTTVTNLEYKPQLFDLTQMLGTTIANYIYSLEQANAGAGVAWFKKLFPADYYPYNAGELISVSGLESHDTVGFNQWDEEWELGTISTANGEPSGSSTQIRSKNFSDCIGGQTYCNSGSTEVCVYFYDADKAYIRYQWMGSGVTYTFPSNARYFKIVPLPTYGTTYKNDICINLSWSGYRNGEYEAYEKHSYPLDNSLTLRGIPKLDASNNLYYDGDEYASDGSVTRKYGVYTFTGNESWGVYTAWGSDHTFVCFGFLPLASTANNILSVLYPTLSQNDVLGGIGTGIYFRGDNKNLYVSDSSLASAENAREKFKAGTIIVYELATPTTETAEPYNNPQVVDNYGTEEYVTSSIVPVGHESIYYTGEWYHANFDKIYGGHVDLAKGIVSSEYNSSLQPITPVETSIDPQTIQLLQGVNTVWSEQGDITAHIVDGYEDVMALTKLPLKITVVGAGTENETVVKIVRRENFAQARPDETDLTGYKGEIIVQKVQTGEDEMEITLNELGSRYLDDGAKYTIVAWVQNDMRQAEPAELDFTVLWEHQAQSMENHATVTISDGTAYISFTKPTGADDTDTIDVYRLSADKPQLIYKGATFTDTVVDPYPTLKDFGGYRVVLVTANGDYTVDSAGSNFSWTDIEAGIESLFQYIDFDGQELPIKYNVELDGQYSHIKTVTHYLGGHIQGDTIVGTEMTGSIRAVLPYDLDMDDFMTLCDLREYAGTCHVRTKLGQNYTALIQVGDGLTYNTPAHPVKITLTIDRVDNPNLDGVLLEDWL